MAQLSHFPEIGNLEMEISLAVVDKGTVVQMTGIATPVPWWSYTKAVIAAGALALVRDGQLALDEPLPKQPYTLRQLLQHRAGVTNYGDLAAYHEAVARGDDPWPIAELLERTRTDKLLFEPGKGLSYSNIGYLFVRQLIEATCNEPLGTVLDRLVLRPLGIQEARITYSPSDLAGVFMGDATSYHPGWVYHGLMVGPLDQAAILLFRLLTGQLLPRELLDQMRATGYGLGVVTGTTDKGQRVTGCTGKGPGSVIAVFHSAEAILPITAAAFRTGDDLLSVVAAAVAPFGP